MNEKRINEIIGSFFTNQGTNFCKNAKELKDCIELKNQYESELKNKGKGCSSCRKKGLISKYKKLIQARLL
tara:strand:+ start:9968 stop:10180 length:213 start_codon:yes stop_codon:yes gene_type:complete